MTTQAEVITPIGARGLDHAVILSHDLDKARATFARLGMTCAPRMFHPFGTANHLIMFQNTFIELLGVADAQRLAESNVGNLRELFARSPGMYFLAFPSNNIAADRDAVLRQGLNPSEPLHFERPVTLPGGRSTRAVVDVVTFDRLAPTISFFLSQQHVPDALWVPNWQQHGSTAEEIEGVVVVSATREECRVYLGKLFGAHAIQAAEVENGRLRMRRGYLDVLTPREFEASFGSDGQVPRFAALVVRVGSLDKCLQWLKRNRVPHEWAGSSVTIPPAAACGIALRFTESADNRPVESSA